MLPSEYLLRRLADDQHHAALRRAQRWRLEQVAGGAAPWAGARPLLVGLAALLLINWLQ